MIKYFKKITAILMVFLLTLSPVSVFAAEEESPLWSQLLSPFGMPQYYSINFAPSETDTELSLTQEAFVGSLWSIWFYGIYGTQGDITVINSNPDLLSCKVNGSAVGSTFTLTRDQFESYDLELEAYCSKAGAATLTFQGVWNGYVGEIANPNFTKTLTFQVKEAPDLPAGLYSEGYKEPYYKGKSIYTGTYRSQAGEEISIDEKGYLSFRGCKSSYPIEITLPEMNGYIRVSDNSRIGFLMPAVFYVDLAKSECKVFHLAYSPGNTSSIPDEIIMMDAKELLNILNNENDQTDTLVHSAVTFIKAK